MKVLLDVAKESSDWFPPLKSCLGGITALVNHYDVRCIKRSWARLTDPPQQYNDVKDKLEELLPWLTKLREGLAKADGNEGQQEVERRARLARSAQNQCLSFPRTDSPQILGRHRTGITNFVGEGEARPVPR